MRADVTHAAEGFDRRSFTVTEILRLQDAGIIREDENFALIEGEIVSTRLAASHSSTGSPKARAGARSPSGVRTRR